MELTSSAREVRTRPGYTANELNELYCLRCHDKMGIPICGACRYFYMTYRIGCHDKMGIPIWGACRYIYI
jgi:hypothetical protein